MKNGLCIITIALAVTIVTFSYFNRSSWYELEMSFSEIMAYESATQRIVFIDSGISDELIDEYGVKDTINIDNSSDSSDVSGHGSMMVSASCGNGYKGVNGFGCNCEIYMIKATDDEGKMTLDNLYYALNYAQRLRADVVNISLGGHISDDRVVKKLKAMYDEDITIVAAAGDYSEKDLLFPASVSEYVISVAAMDCKRKIWVDSNTSDSLTCVFPGEDIYVINGNNSREKISGTSQATAIASGYIAKLKGCYFANVGKTLENEQLKKYVEALNVNCDEKIDYAMPFKQIAKK